MSSTWTWSEHMQGIYYDRQTSRRQHCTLRIDDNGLVHVDAIEREPVPMEDMEISPRVGRAMRFLTFPDGASFETADNEGVDEAFAEVLALRPSHLVHYWERSKLAILGSAAFIVLFTAGMVFYGIPAGARLVSTWIPMEVSRTLGDEVLANLDREIFSPSKLDAGRQQALRERFETHDPDLPETAFRLEFRDGGDIGANALALPNGTIIMTDALVRLAEDDRELEAVMLHEIGHIVERHSLRRLIEYSGGAALMVWLTGDVSGSWISLLPFILMQTGYSRELEWEADGYALQKMQYHDISPLYFASFMRKLENYGKFRLYRQDGEKPDAPMPEQANRDSGKEQRESQWQDYFSSHPPTADRIRRFETAAGIAP